MPGKVIPHQRVADVVAVELRQQQVQQYQVRRLAPGQRQPGHAVAGVQHRVSLRLKHFLKHGGGGFAVFDQHYFTLAHLLPPGP